MNTHRNKNNKTHVDVDVHVAVTVVVMMMILMMTMMMASKVDHESRVFSFRYHRTELLMASWFLDSQPLKTIKLCMPVSIHKSSAQISCALLFLFTIAQYN